MRGPGRLASLTVVFGVAGAVLALFGHVYLNSDTLWALVWGRELLGGELPGFDSPDTPTPHPLTTVVAGLASGLGEEGGYYCMAALVLLSFGAFLLAVFRLGQLAYSTAVGLLSALLVGTSALLLLRTASAFQDITFAALVATAAVLELRSPRRGLPVLALLAIAGLIRPEAWLLSGVYWLYLLPTSGRRQLPGLTLAAAAAPLLWTASDLLVTGDPLFSLTDTRQGARRLGRTTGLDDVPHEGLRLTRDLLGAVTAIGGVAGVAVAATLLPRRSAVLLALTALGALTFAGFGAAGLSLLDRYLIVPAAVLAIFFSLAALGWTLCPPGRRRRVWTAGGLALLAALAVSVPDRAHDIAEVDAEVDANARLVGDLRELDRDPAATAVLERCPRIYLRNQAPRGLVSYVLDRPAGEVLSARTVTPTRGAFLSAPEAAIAREKLAFFVKRSSAAPAPPPTSFRLDYRTRYWELRSSGGC
jgi:hypothetical protein